MYQRREHHCPAKSKPLARCVETCHVAQAQQIIPGQEDLDMFPQILVHPPRAQTKSNLILKTTNRISKHCGMTREQHPRRTQPKNSPESTQRTGKSCQQASRDKEHHRKQLSNGRIHALKRHKQELCRGDPQNVVHNIPRTRRHRDAEKNGDTRKP